MAVAVFAAGPDAYAQLRINSSPSPVGSGARALGMGGAFIAVADDATAASWNPGGLTQLERPELSIVYNWKWFAEEFSETARISPGGPRDINLDEINYLSFVWPIPWTLAGRNFVVSLNYQRKYDFDRKLSLRGRGSDAPSNPLFRIMSLNDFTVDYEQDGHLAALSPAFGFELTDRISLGMAVNIWDSSLVPGNQWESETEQRAVTRLFLRRLGANSETVRLVTGGANLRQKYEDIEGVNYTFGLLYKPTERLSLGAVYHTAYATDVAYTRIRRLRNPFGTDHYRNNLRIEWPGAVGLGAAYRFPNDKLTVSLDVTRRNWDRFVQVDDRDGLTARISPITGLSTSKTDIDPTYTIRAGAEYVFVNPDKARQTMLPSLRAGLFYDPEPASGRKEHWWGIDKGDGDPDDFYGISLGAGLLLKNRVNLDIAYTYRWGNGARKDTLAGAGAFERGFDADVEQHLLYLSTVIYF